MSTDNGSKPSAGRHQGGITKEVDADLGRRTQAFLRGTQGKGKPMCYPAPKGKP